MLIIFGVVLLSILLSSCLPFLYQSARVNVAKSHEELKLSPCVVHRNPFLAVLLLSGGMLPLWTMTHSPGLAIFVMLLGSAAYIDYITQWVPDVLIFGLAWVALITIIPSQPDLISSLSGAAIIILPALMLNLINWLRSQPAVFASGDLYLLPSLGVWLAPQSSGICIAISLIIAVAVNFYVREVPFITVIYPVFVGVIICGAW